MTVRSHQSLMTIAEGRLPAAYGEPLTAAPIV
jgi:hypothetical protein